MFQFCPLIKAWIKLCHTTQSTETPLSQIPPLAKARKEPSDTEGSSLSQQLWQACSQERWFRQEKAGRFRACLWQGCLMHVSDTPILKHGPAQAESPPHLLSSQRLPSTSSHQPAARKSLPLLYTWHLEKPSKLLFLNICTFGHHLYFPMSFIWNIKRQNLCLLFKLTL